MSVRPRAPLSSPHVPGPDPRRAGRLPRPTGPMDDGLRRRRWPRRLTGRARLGVAFGTLVAALTAGTLGATTAAAADPDFPARDSRYHNLAEMTAAVQAAADAHPDIVRVFSIGESYQGRQILAAKISDNVDTDEDEPELLFDALHHAREHLTVEQALYLLDMLVDGYDQWTTIRNIVDYREIYIVFALNPDGFVYDLTGDPYRAWRKNRQPNAGGSVGTDLNRNYDYRWACCGGSSGNPASITYRGPSAFSAPETRALRDFVRSRVVNGIQQIRAHITFHTNGQLILWPYGYTKTNVPGDMTQTDWSTFVKLGREMAARNGYKAQQSSDLYITDGDQIDWLYGRYRIFSFTWELYPPETATVWGDHYPPDETIARETARNRAALIYFLKLGGCPYDAVGLGGPNCGPFFDDIEGSHGWLADPDGTDTATSGRWHRWNPEATSSNGAKQLGTTTSGTRDLVTDGRAGSSAGANDVDGGVTTIRSAPIDLPGDITRVGPLTFRWTFAHDANATSADQLRLYVETEAGDRTLVWSVEGASSDRDAAWQQTWLSVDDYAGQTIRLVFQAEDGAEDNLVEAAVDDVRIRRES